MASSNTEEARKLDREIRDAISQLTDRLPAFDARDDRSEKGVRIITIAGDNKGATMRKQASGSSTAGLMSRQNQHYDCADDAQEGEVYEDDDGAVRAYANSNYQAVNNSVLVGGSCTAEHPGVHIEVVSESLHGDDSGEESEDEHERKKKEKKKEKKEKEKKKKKGLVLSPKREHNDSEEDNA